MSHLSLLECCCAGLQNAVAMVESQKAVLFASVTMPGLPWESWAGQEQNVICVSPQMQLQLCFKVSYAAMTPGAEVPSLEGSDQGRPAKLPTAGVLGASANGSDMADGCRQEHCDALEPEGWFCYHVVLPWK